MVVGFESYKGRTLEGVGRVRVHWHVTRLCWSLKAVDGVHKGYVVGYARELVLSDVRFLVRPSGRAQVLRERRKNVHAYAEGKLEACAHAVCERRVRYNPYEYDYFHWADTHARVDGVELLHLQDKARCMAPQEV
jgi:hypothetical protein